MADTLSTTSTLDNLYSTYFVKRALPRLNATPQFYKFATKQPLPLGEGTTIRFNGWSNLTPISSFLSEGTNPSLTGLSSRKVEATLHQLGRGVKLSELARKTCSLDALKGAADVLTTNAIESIDKTVQLAIFKNDLVQNSGTKILSAWMSAVASAFHAGSNSAEASTQAWGFPVVFGTTATRLSAVGTTVSTSAQMSLFALRKAVGQIRDLNAMEFADGYFKCIMDSKSIRDLRQDTSYKDWHQYLDNSSMKKGDATAPAEGCRIYQDNYLPKYRSDSHSCRLSFVFGQGAYACVSLGNGSGRGFEIIIKRPNQYDTSNTHNMYGTMGWKAEMVATALNVSCGRVLITHEA